MALIYALLEYTKLTGGERRESLEGGQAYTSEAACHS